MLAPAGKRRIPAVDPRIEAYAKLLVERSLDVQPGWQVWINSSPLKLDKLRGKVVLIDFWAFDCPFCAEAMPHVKEMYDKYAKDGLVIIGVHVPRIDYEKEIPKIKEAVVKKGIKYPVVVDNKYQIWSDYLCNTWPSHLVVDQDGVIQLSHSGTERYEDTEKVIQKLLAKNNGK